MKRKFCWMGALLALSPAILLLGGSTGSTVLMLNVEPESHISPAQFPFQFVVAEDPAQNVTSQAQTFFLWVRARPGESIHLKATLRSVAPPPGEAFRQALNWTGSRLAAISGGLLPTCTSGSFARSDTQEFVAGFTQSGTLSCRMTLSLASPDLPPGRYTGVVDLAIAVE